MVNCSLCGKEELLFTCHYCGSGFCSEHRLPESHGCPGILRAKEDARTKLADSFSGYYDYDNDEEHPKFVTSVPRSPRRKRRNRFSSRELRDLGIASILVSLVAFSMLGSGAGLGIVAAITNLPVFVANGTIWIIFPLIILFLAAFMIHEMAHKFTAQRYGMWSEFRMTTAGYYLSAVAIIFSVPIFGTGVVYASGAKSAEDNARVNIAGPLSNLIFGSILGFIAVIIPVSYGSPIPYSELTLWFVMFILQYGVILNAMLGLFNLLPFQPFDGGTVFAWDRKIWLILVIALLMTAIHGYIIIPNVLY
jgi:Zn-dependent protease